MAPTQERHPAVQLDKYSNHLKVFTQRHWAVHEEVAVEWSLDGESVTVRPIRVRIDGIGLVIAPV
jgi:hypothetical protein